MLESLTTSSKVLSPPTVCMAHTISLGIHPKVRLMPRFNSDTSIWIPSSKSYPAPWYRFPYKLQENLETLSAWNPNAIYNSEQWNPKFKTWMIWPLFRELAQRFRVILFFCEAPRIEYLLFVRQLTKKFQNSKSQCQEARLTTNSFIFFFLKLYLFVYFGCAVVSATAGFFSLGKEGLAAPWAQCVGFSLRGPLHHGTWAPGQKSEVMSAASVVAAPDSRAMAWQLPGLSCFMVCGIFQDWIHVSLLAVRIFYPEGPGSSPFIFHARKHQLILISVTLSYQLQLVTLRY